MRPLFLLLSLQLLLTSGCLGDYALDRHLSISQLASRDSPGQKFEVDMSKIPASWIEERSEVAKPWGTEEQIRIASRHPVKIVLVPLEK